MFLMIQQQSVVYLGLGANLEDRLVTLRSAVASLDALESTCVSKVSGVYETEPWGLTDQPKFLNIAVEIETAFSPIELLRLLKDVETRLGRTPALRWGPRMVDIDIILWGDTLMQTRELTIPHVFFRDRHFVLTPLAEIAPHVVDPVTGNTVKALLNSLALDALTPCATIGYS
jgi:2-amino-4-hydroxy-6-hydroxymethyldihydropteridine diphosphokinase